MRFRFWFLKIWEKPNGLVSGWQKVPQTEPNQTSPTLVCGVWISDKGWVKFEACFSSVCRVWISDKRWVNSIVCFGTGLKVISVRFESVVQTYLWVCHWVCSYRLIREAATSSSAEKKRTSISCNIYIYIYIAVINLTFIFLSFLNHARLISSLKRRPLSLVMVMQYPSGLRGQSEQSKDSPRIVLGQSKLSPSSVWILQFKDLVRIPLRLSWDSARTTLIT